MEQNPEDAYYEIEALHDFDIDAEEPIKARPFKPKYHMTMGMYISVTNDLDNNPYPTIS